MESAFLNISNSVQKMITQDGKIEDNKENKDSSNPHKKFADFIAVELASMSDEMCKKKKKEIMQIIFDY